MTSEELTILEVASSTASIRRTYDIWSYCYNQISLSMEHEPRMQGLERAAIRFHDRVLEAAGGLGVTLVEILRRVEKTHVVCGIDLSHPLGEPILNWKRIERT